MIAIHMLVSLAIVKCAEVIHCQVYVCLQKLTPKTGFLKRNINSLVNLQVGCQLPTKVPRDHLYRVGPAYSLNNETDIMIEIFESGPVQGKQKKKHI